MSGQRSTGAKDAAFDPQETVRETHHRISNHLQILASLVALQARRHPHPVVRDALLDVRLRILAIARLNTELQKATRHGDVELGRFLKRLKEDLRLGLVGEPGMDLDLKVEIDNALVRPETAMSIGLIVNELVTNAVKYALLPRGGRVGIELRTTPDGDYRLTVVDDGPGMPKDAMNGDRSGHGLQLVQSLAQRLEGALTFDYANQGASVSVTFH